MDRMKFLAEQVFNEQDTMYNVLAEENIALGNWTVDELMPYLEARADARDHRAQDLLIELNQLLRGVS
jgi:hypothetical protein